MTAFEKLFESDAMRAATQADFRQARELGIGGFPSVVVRRNDEMALLTRGWEPLERPKSLGTSPPTPFGAAMREAPASSMARTDHGRLTTQAPHVEQS